MRIKIMFHKYAPIRLRSKGICRDLIFHALSAAKGNILGKYIGKSGDHLVITWHGETVVDVPPRTVAHEGPVYERPVQRPEYQDDDVTLQGVSQMHHVVPYGLAYNTGSFTRQYGSVLKNLFKYALPGGGKPPQAALA